MDARQTQCHDNLAGLWPVELKLIAVSYHKAEIGLKLTENRYKLYSETTQGNKSHVLQQVVFRYKFYSVDLKRGFVSEQWSLNPFLNNAWFLRVCSTSPLKTLWDKEKLLIPV